MQGKAQVLSGHLLFRAVPFLLVFCWLTVFIIRSPFLISSVPEKAKSAVPEQQYESLMIKARKINSSGEYFVKRTINLSDTVVYIDMWRSHWCTYYNDREFFFTPRINELAQRLRTVGLPIVHISMGADAYTGHTRQRKMGIKAVQNGNLSVLEKYNAQAARYHKDYIPGFQDTCVYKDQERFGKYRDNHLTKQIAVAEDDYMVQNFRESAESFVGLGKKTVIFLGQHTNMCLMAVFLYCREVGLDLIIVRDLVDACWLYELQKHHCKTHTEGNAAVNNYFDEKFGSSILSYDLIRALNKLKIERKKPIYSWFTNVAHMFKYLY